MLIGVIGLASLLSLFTVESVLTIAPKYKLEIGLAAFLWMLLLVVSVGIIGGCACRWRITFAGVALVALAAPISTHLSKLAHRVQSPLSIADPVTLAITLVPSFCVLLLPAGIAHALASMDRKIPNINLCRKCKYSLRGNVSGRCPECGTPVTHVGNKRFDSQI